MRRPLGMPLLFGLTLSISAAISIAAPSRSEDGADETLFNRWQDAADRQIEADARSGAKRAFMSRADAQQFLSTLTPAGMKPREEFFGSLMGGSDSESSSRLAVYARSHLDIVHRRIDACAAKIKPLFEQIASNLERDFPAAQASDPVDTPARAKRQKRPAVILFCADWAAPCGELHRIFADPSVQQALSRFVRASVDMTDEDSAATARVKRAFHADTLPLILVFDRSGNPISRENGVANAAELKALLARTK